MTMLFEMEHTMIIDNISFYFRFQSHAIQSLHQNNSLLPAPSISPRKVGGQQPSYRGGGQQPVSKGGGQQPSYRGGGQQPASSCGGQQEASRGGGQQPASNTVHINPKFANRPLPGVPPGLLQPSGGRAGVDTTDIASLYQNSSSTHVYINSTAGNSDHIYQNLNPVLPQSAGPIYQNSNQISTSIASKEPIYASIGHGIPLDASKKDEFIQSIKHSLENQMPLTTTATMSSNNSHTAARDNKVQVIYKKLKDLWLKNN